MKVERAFSPAGITSFFLIKDVHEDGTPIKDPERVGACGGGFVIGHGVTTEVRAEPARRPRARVFINGQETREAPTTLRVVERMAGMVDESLRMEVRHGVDVPIGAGYGSSGAGAVSTSIALARLLDLDLTLNQAALIAHVCEVECGTGLGTVGPLTRGGLVITLESGGPGIAVIDRLLAKPDLKVVTIYFDSIYTKWMLGSREVRARVDEWGAATLKRVRENPDVESFMRWSKDFASKMGLMTPRVAEAIGVLEGAGALGATQNMVGEAVHGVFEIEDVERGVRAASKYRDARVVLVSDIDLEGARPL